MPKSRARDKDIYAYRKLRRSILAASDVCHLCSHSGADTIDHVVAGRLETKIATMGRVLNDPGLDDLALPDLDDRLSPADVALGPDSTADLAVLFAHLRDQIARRAG